MTVNLQLKGFASVVLPNLVNCVLCLPGPIIFEQFYRMFGLDLHISYWKNTLSVSNFTARLIVDKCSVGGEELRGSGAESRRGFPLRRRSLPL